MTVAELIAALEKIEDKSRIVRIEGCDCINPAAGVDDSTPYGVLIEAKLS